MISVKEIIKTLDLQPHPEGGYFREVYRSEGVIPNSNLTDNFQGDRNYATSIYYLLESGDFSAFHKINQDETWHFYIGDAIELHVISENGSLSTIKIGNDISNGEIPQFTVQKHDWFAAKVKNPDTFALVGCTVSPGFDFRDFELASHDMLVEKYPEHKALIKAFTRH
ncbi:MAG: cupin domain-containing protein [Winogradskyella sp.]|uniref:cupin domain-containing protein n=1 Tax=Winogradskyella sp. TaxID=1883156 RepID=UPI000F41969B|nr:cupin domain-containing protein [Winogradskyella sp.]RNC87071.1 MAG: cupin domain-containing protein [Winogradskyella sp.]